MIEDEYKILEKDVFARMSKSLSSQHDLEHVKRVKFNSVKIVKILNLQDKVNLNLVTINALIHDLTYTFYQESIYTYLMEGKIMKKFLPSYLDNFNINHKDQQIIINAVQRHPHSFPFHLLNKKSDIYTRILQDADTIDFFNKKRINSFNKKFRRPYVKRFIIVISKLLESNRRHILKIFLNYPELARHLY
jgi:HD superfamily phosphodiesterase